MNCQDIVRILDDQDFTRMTDDEQQAVKLHLAFCPECARDWEIQSQLSTVAIPAMSRELVGRCRMHFAASSGSGRAQTRSRIIMVSTILVVAAVAAMVGVRLVGSPQPPAVALPIVSQPASVPIHPLIEVRFPDDKGVVPATVSSTASAVPPPSRSFTVSVLPPVHDPDLPAGRIAIDAFHAAVLTELGKVPDLVVVAPQMPAEFRITMKAAVPHAVLAVDSRIRLDTWRALVSVEGGLQEVKYAASMGGFHPGQCPASDAQLSTGNSCREPSALAASLVATLRKLVFPVDPSVQRQLLTQLQNRALSPAENARALQEFESLVASGRGIWDAATIQSVMELTATDKADKRLRIWGWLRGVKDPALMPHLLNAMRSDPDERIRLGTMWYLQNDYAADPRTRAAFESVVRDDSRELVRQAARRILYGDAGWRNYVAGNLTNASLSDEARLEPLGYIAQSNALTAELPMILDEQSVAALAEMLPRLWSDPQQAARAGQVMSLLHRAGHPAAVDLMVKAIRTGPEPLIPEMALILKTGTHRDDPRVLSALEEAGIRFPRLRPAMESIRSPAFPTATPDR